VVKRQRVKPKSNWQSHGTLQRALRLFLVGAICLAALIGNAYSFTELYRFPDPYPYPSGLTLGTDGSFYGTCESAGAFGLGYVFRVTTNGDLSTLASFAGANGAKPIGGVVVGRDGALYGTTHGGGTAGIGTVFRVTTNGLLTSLFSFTGTNGPYQGGNPVGLTTGSDGAFYGCCWWDDGIFRMTTSGEFTRFAVLSAGGGGRVTGPMTEGPDRAFYGTTIDGGFTNLGTVFRVTTNGEVAALFEFSGTNGMRPMSRVIFGADGALYGTTYLGGAYDRGTVFRCTTNGNHSTLYHFVAGSTALLPRAGLVQHTNGLLYGACESGEAYGVQGGIFSITTNGMLTNMVTFSGGNGASMRYEFITGPDGALYGTTPAGGHANVGLAFRMTANGVLTPLASFAPWGPAGPDQTLYRGDDGVLYGTTPNGGTNGVGTVFTLETNGTMSVSSFETATGVNPSSPLFAAPDGAFYGVAYSGGISGDGTLYRFTRSNGITLIASFDFTNGLGPRGPLCLGSDGAIYGTASNGGEYGYGAAFRFTTNGSLTVLASFTFESGTFPDRGMIRGHDGSFYGIAGTGGQYDNGTVFRITTNGTLSALASFNPSTFGLRSRGTLAQGTDGFLYGTTFYSSPSGGYGTVFRAGTNGGLTKLCDLLRPSYPEGPLLFGPDGALYATSIENDGGVIGGTVYRVTTNGVVSVLYYFDNYITGSLPLGGVILDQNFQAYGVTSSGPYAETTADQNFAGTIFRLDLSSNLQAGVKLPNGFVLSFSGMPSVQYQLLRATRITGPWANLAIVKPDASGSGRYTNSFPPATNAFYRMKIR